MNDRSPRRLVGAALAILVSTATSSCARTEHLRVSGVRRPPPLENGFVDIRFDVRWPDSFRNAVTWDAAWIFVKFRIGEGPWRHATLSTEAVHHSVGPRPDVAVILQPSLDGRGIFLYRAEAGRGPTKWDDVRVRWRYATDAVEDGSAADVRVFALDMVHIPDGSFDAGDGEIGRVSGHLRSGDGNAPFHFENENAITAGGHDAGRLGNSNGYGMNEPTGLLRPVRGVPDDFDDTRWVVVPAEFPKGVRAYYIMKREVTQGEYAMFLNTLTARQQRNRNPSRDSTDQAQTGVDRYSISSMPPFFASVPDRGANFLSWADGAAFADWAALRPMTELEFEKASRGPAEPTPGEFAWGSREIHQHRYVLSGDGTISERVRNPSGRAGNAAYRETSGGAGRGCASCLGGPLPAGSFASQPTRSRAGASFYGVLDLSGNLAEHTITIGQRAGRMFSGTHGDGELDGGGYAGGPEVARWPGSTRSGRGYRVRGALGTGFRGGSWASPWAQLRVSDRSLAATPDSRRRSTYGIRLVRTAPVEPSPDVPTPTDGTANAPGAGDPPAA